MTIHTTDPSDPRQEPLSADEQLAQDMTDRQAGMDATPADTQQLARRTAEAGRVKGARA